MTTPVFDSGDSRALLHTVARLHYLSDLSQVQIARQLGVSTATISRLLQRARAEGVVRIEVRDLIAPEAVAEQLAERLALRRVSVVEAPATALPGALAAPLGAMLLAEGLCAGEVLAMGWGRAVQGLIEAGLPAVPGVIVVPATGGMQQQAPHFQINEFVRRAAEQLGGAPHFIHAPYLPAAGTRESFLADPAIASSVALWDRIDVVVVGIGQPPTLAAPETFISTPDEAALTGAVGDVVRHYFDADGQMIHWEGGERMIATAPDQLRAARLCIGVAVGMAKVAAIVGAARAGLITALITDLQTAEAVLEHTALPRQSGS